MPPRHTKSEFASYLLPAWMVGRDPKLKIIQATHTAELAIRFGRKAKNLIDREDYTKIFQTRLQEDSKALQDVGRHHKVVNTLLLVLAVQSQVVVQILLSLTIHTRNKMHCHLQPWSQPMSGIHQVHVNVYNQAVGSC